MSTSTNQQRPALPPAAVDRVFERLNAIFGVQRMAASWGAVPPDERRAVWGGAIARAVWSDARQGYDLESIGAALDELADKPTPWPPSSGQFADACERYAQRPGRNLLSLPVPRRTDAQLAHGRQQMERIKSLLRTATKSIPGREPGCDDESPPPIVTPACTCWVGLTRQPTLCSACAAKPVAMMVRESA